MNINGNSQTTNGREGRPLNSLARSAGWAELLGLALLLLSAMPSYAAKPKPSKLSPDLMSAVGSNGLVTVNVQFKNYPSKGYLKGRRSQWRHSSVAATDDHRGDHDRARQHAHDPGQ